MQVAICLAITAIPAVALSQIDVQNFGPDTHIASVGDQVQVEFSYQNPGILSFTSVYYVCYLDPDAAYVPGSVRVDGFPQSDGGGNVAVYADRIEVSQGLVLFGFHDITFQIQVVGPIGQAIQFDGSFQEGQDAQVTIAGGPIHIEDENAYLEEATLRQDTSIRAGNPGFNYGTAQAISLGDIQGDERRGLVQYDFFGPVLEGVELVAGRFSLWLLSPPSKSTFLSAHVVQQPWVEGQMEGAPCFNGVNWTTRDCLTGWKPGGQYDTNVAGSIQITTASPFHLMDITALAGDWTEGFKTNYGMALVPTTAASSPFAISTRESRSMPQPRLDLIKAVAGTYQTAAAVDTEAEIQPNEVLSGSPDHRFVYSFLPVIQGSQTGINRLRFDVPAGFSVTSVDTVTIGGIQVTEDQNGILTPTEYQVWNMADQIDIRLGSAIQSATPDPLTQIVFHADVPSAPDGTDFEFYGYVDHDRRGYPVQAADEGDADGDDDDDDKWRVRTVEPKVIAVTVAPSDTTVARGQVVPYRAWARYDNGVFLEITPVAQWSVQPALGSFVTGTTADLHTSAEGSGVVTATYDDVTSGPANLTVDPAALEDLWLDPVATSAAVGLTDSVTAWGEYTDAQVVDVTLSANWWVTDTAIADTVSAGVWVGLQEGSSELNAELDGILATPASLDVTPPILVSLAVTPADTTLALGQSTQMLAWGTYSDGSVQDITGAVTDWNSDDVGVVDVGADGVAQTLGEGSAQITATANSVVSPPVDITVSPPILIALDGSPDTADVPLGVDHFVSTVGTYSDASQVDETANATWWSLDPAVADFITRGQVATLSVGSARLLHKLGTVYGDTLIVDVTATTLDSLTVSPSPILLPEGVEIPLTATAHYSNGSRSNVSSQANWSIDVPAVASVDTAGTLRTLTEGVAQISVDFQAVFAPVMDLTVDNAALDSLIVTPPDTTVALGDPVTYRAWGFLGNNVHDLSASVVWGVSDSGVASIDTTGLVQTLAAGSTEIQASLGMVSAVPGTLIVDPASVVAVALSPASATVLLGKSKDFTAQAEYSDGSMVDVSDQSAWNSSVPTVAYVDTDGTATALNQGSSNIRATFSSVQSPNAPLTVLPAVELLALPTGSVESNPGDNDQLALTLRLTNHYLDVRTLTALRVTVSGGDVVLPVPKMPPGQQSQNGTDGGFDRLQLFLDDGDGDFEPGQDTHLDFGPVAAGTWTATGLSVAIGVGGSVTLFATGDVALHTVKHLDMLDAWIEDDGDLFWSSPTAVVAPSGFPANSPGEITVTDLVLAQVSFTAAPPDTAGPGATGVELFRLVVPSDGGTADVLTSFSVEQRGTARAGLELDAIRLEALNSGTFAPLATLASTGGATWVASGLNQSVPANGKTLRVVADLATSAELGRTLRGALPVDGLEFSSGRVGPVDGEWVSPHQVYIDVVPELSIAPRSVMDGAIHPRTTTRLPVLGLDVTLVSADPDSLASVVLRHVSTGPAGPAANLHAQVERLVLWHDTDLNGTVSPGDQELSSGIVDLAGGIRFEGDLLPLALESGTPVPLLITLDPDTVLVRDAEMLAVQLEGPEGVQLTSGLAGSIVNSPADTLVTEFAPVIDGQSAAGYQVHPAAGGIVFAGTSGTVVLDFLPPANGVDADFLNRLTVRNLGSAPPEDIQALRLWRDDGSQDFDANLDTQVGSFSAAGPLWTLDGVNVSLPVSAPRRFFVTMDLPNSLGSGGTFQLRVDLLGVEVASGNDGPIDVPFSAGPPFTLAVGERITWVAEAQPSLAVDPDIQDRPVLVLTGFNGYLNSRSLTSLNVTLATTVGETEFGTWGLHPDLDGNGQLGPSEDALALATVSGGMVRFEVFTHPLPPLSQTRFFVTYSLSGSSRDGATIDAYVSTPSGFGYADAGEPTTSLGEFPMNSAGEDMVDGHLARQIHETPASPRTLGGLETGVLALDIVLPSDGPQLDVLQGLLVDLLDGSGGEDAVVLGEDLSALQLWRELDDDPWTASFDAQQDELLDTVVSGTSPLSFTGFNATVPNGGRRFYVTVDVADTTLVEGRVVRLGIPVDGVAMVSNNDGPRDTSLVGSTLHTISTSDLLLSIAAQPAQLSAGQSTELLLAVENRGTSTLDPVDVLALVPPAGATSLSGPVPPTLSLAPASTDTLRYVFQLDTPGQHQFTGSVGVADSSVVSTPATSPTITVQSPPSGLSVAPLASLPPSVNRGQTGVSPVVWTHTHQDQDPLAATILVTELRLVVEDGSGSAQSAADVWSRLEIRAGGQSLATLAPVPAQSSLVIPLSPPLSIAPAEKRDVAILVDIDANAPASSFRVRFDPDVWRAEDLNSGAAIPLAGTLPFLTASSLIRTLATQADVEPLPQLPGFINRGQASVAAGRFLVSIPGPPGESEVRVLGFSMALVDSAGAPLDPEDLLDRVRVLSGAQPILDTTDFGVPGVLDLTLDLPKVIGSGVTEALDIQLDIRADTPLDHFAMAVGDSSTFVVRDDNSGMFIPINFVASDSSSTTQGPAWLQDPAPDPAVRIQSGVPASAWAAQPAVPIASIQVDHTGSSSSSSVRVERLRFRLVDEEGAPQVPSSVIQRATLRHGTQVIALDASPPGLGVEVELTFAGPLSVVGGASETLDLEVDLANGISVDWLRVALDGNAFTIRDANDPLRLLGPSGDLPFATELVRVVSAATAVAGGITQAPPSNVVAGETDRLIFPVDIAHPGGSNESDLDLDRLVLTVADRGRNPVEAAGVLSRAILRWNTVEVVATVTADSVSFDLAPLGSLSPTESIAPELVVDVVGQPVVSDFLFRLATPGLSASSGGDPLATVAVPGAELPYDSPSIHVNRASLEDSFSNYPNPFAAGRDLCHVSFFLPTDARVTLEVYTLDGTRVKRLLDGVPLSAGLHDDVEWDGRNGDGRVVRNGTYLLRIAADGASGGEFIRKLAVVR